MAILLLFVVVNIEFSITMMGFIASCEGSVFGEASVGLHVFLSSFVLHRCFHCGCLSIWEINVN